MSVEYVLMRMQYAGHMQAYISVHISCAVKFEYFYMSVTKQMKADPCQLLFWLFDPNFTYMQRQIDNYSAPKMGTSCCTA